MSKPIQMSAICTWHVKWGAAYIVDPELDLRMTSYESKNAYMWLDRERAQEWCDGVIRRYVASTGTDKPILTIERARP